MPVVVKKQSVFHLLYFTGESIVRVIDRSPYLPRAEIRLWEQAFCFLTALCFNACHYFSVNSLSSEMIYYSPVGMSSALN